jgi:hypothetical protein
MSEESVKMAKNDQKTMVAGLLAQLAKDVRTRTPEHFRDWLCEQSNEQLKTLFEAMQAVGLFPALKLLCDLARPAYTNEVRTVADWDRDDAVDAADAPSPKDQDERSESDGDPGDGAGC